jgi:hypothetical protein
MEHISRWCGEPPSVWSSVPWEVPLDSKVFQHYDALNPPSAELSLTIGAKNCPCRGFGNFQRVAGKFRAVK